MTVSAPHLVAQRIFSTSSSMLDARALLPMLALILTRKLRPMIIGSASGWLILAGMMARPAATSTSDEFGSNFRWNSLGKTAKNRGSSGFKLIRVFSEALPACCLINHCACCRRQIRNSQFAIRNSHIFPDGDEFHFGRDDAGAGISQLCDSLSGLCPE